MIKGTTASGFAYEVSEDALNDYEILESLAELEENPLVFTTVAKGFWAQSSSKGSKTIHATKRHSAY